MTRIAASRMADVGKIAALKAMGIISPAAAIERIVRLIDETPSAERDAFVEVLRQSGPHLYEMAVEEWRWREKQAGAL